MRSLRPSGGTRPDSVDEEEKPNCQDWKTWFSRDGMFAIGNSLAAHLYRQIGFWKETVGWDVYDEVAPIVCNGLSKCIKGCISESMESRCRMSYIAFTEDCPYGPMGLAFNLVSTVGDDAVTGFLFAYQLQRMSICNKSPRSTWLFMHNICSR